MFKKLSKHFTPATTHSIKHLFAIRYIYMDY